ncbi:pyrimidine dimer DNA glycosylase [candidate division WWE3 bacterium]|uniref:Pyrimidine dimer DNA glycosylase n=1 Tax=candidate division WWE3 bacterium TaxID=2053526 RepID=A0A955LVR3_UNCKA|nr:pyrimidine dimer DNA glycosylase [candidate division WWE3 bacterium]
MIIWDIEPSLLCTKHLHELHDDIHALWLILTTEKYVHTHHPEIKRWQGKLKALHARHDEIIIEFARRGIEHTSSLDFSNATGNEIQSVFLHTPVEQARILTSLNCYCFV